jgi:acyl carrier protein
LKEEDLRNHLKKNLPDYMLPAFFIFIDVLPLKPNGKVDREALSTLIDYQSTDDETYIAPRNAVERLLVAIWSGELGIKKIGIQDNFFHLGGHSLLIIRLKTRIEETFQLQIPLRLFFEFPTIEEFANNVLREYLPPEKLERTAEIVLEVAQLSETEAQALLERKRHIPR